MCAERDTYVHVVLLLSSRVKESSFFSRSCQLFSRRFTTEVVPVFQMKVQSIADVGMDQCECSDQRLGSTGIGPCVCSLVILNNGKDVLIEHRSGVDLPSKFTELHAIQYLKHIAKHIYALLPGSNIT